MFMHAEPHLREALESQNHLMECSLTISTQIHNNQDEAVLDVVSEIAVDDNA